MRAIMMAGALATTAFAGGSALAQGSHVHHSFCLKTGSGQECAYDSMANAKPPSAAAPIPAWRIARRRIIKRSFQPGAFTR